MYLKKWLYSASVRAAKTAAQAFLAVTGTTTILSTTELKTAVISAVVAAVLSYITSIAGLPEVNNGL